MQYKKEHAQRFSSTSSMYLTRRTYQHREHSTRNVGLVRLGVRDNETDKAAAEQRDDHLADDEEVLRDEVDGGDTGEVAPNETER